MPAAGDEWWWRLLTAAGPRLDGTDGGGDARGAAGTNAPAATGTPDSGEPPAGPDTASDTVVGVVAQLPGERPSFGAVVIHVVSSDDLTRRAGWMYAQIMLDNRRHTRLLLLASLSGGLVLLGGLAGLVVLIQACGLTSPWAVGSVVAAASSPVTAIAYGFARLLLRCAEAIRSPLSADAPPSDPDPSPDPGAASRP
ncbi:hypothetical protein [Streptomyces sp. cg35]|uniref:hypothetical protein n=1 Tax=Streptomyces sp. cg35 TaxID=3421650 RepID=UPI003D16B8BB